MQGFNSQRQNLRVGIGLDFAELVSRSGHDFGKIYLGLRCQAQCPNNAHADTADFLAMDLRWSYSDALVSKDLKRPAAMSAAPICTAAQSALR